MKSKSYYQRQEEMANMVKEFVGQSLALPVKQRPSFRTFGLNVWLSTGLKPEQVAKVMSLMQVVVEDDRVVKP